MFSKMSSLDQREGLATSARARVLLPAGQRDDSRWIAAALLHDAGKQVSALGVFGRVTASLVGSVVPASRRAAWAAAPSHQFRRRAWEYLEHDLLGAESLAEAGARPRSSPGPGCTTVRNCGPIWGSRRVWRPLWPGPTARSCNAEAISSDVTFEESSLRDRPIHDVSAAPMDLRSRLHRGQLARRAANSAPRVTAPDVVAGASPSASSCSLRCSSACWRGRSSNPAGSTGSSTGASNSVRTALDDATASGNTDAVAKYLQKSYHQTGAYPMLSESDRTQIAIRTSPASPTCGAHHRVPWCLR